jgi:RNA polymerase sigma-70 factor, ECF subfamily
MSGHCGCPADADGRQPDGGGLPRNEPGRSQRLAAGVGAEPRLRLLDAARLPDHRDRLFRAACVMCATREDAEDLVQETYTRVLQRQRFVRRDDDLAYLLQVLRNTWINTYRARLRQPNTVAFDESIDFVIDEAADPGASIVGLQAIYAVVSQLSPVLRDTLIAVDILDLSYKDAARALRTRPGTIMSRLHRARNEVALRLTADAATTAEKIDAGTRLRGV